MSDYTVITRGPWRIRTSGISDSQAAISYRVDGRSDVVAVESHVDLIELRAAIAEYLEAAGVSE